MELAVIEDSAILGVCLYLSTVCVPYANHMKVLDDEFRSGTGAHTQLLVTDLLSILGLQHLSAITH